MPPIDGSQYATLGIEERRALFFAVWMPTAVSVSAYVKYCKEKHFSTTPEACRRAFARLEAFGYVELKNHRKELFCECLRPVDAKTAVWMARDADQGRWWPQNDNELCMLVTGQRHYSYSYLDGETSTIGWAFVWLRALAIGAGGLTEEQLKWEQPKYIANAAGALAGTLLRLDPAAFALPAKKFARKADDFLTALVSEMFRLAVPAQWLAKQLIDRGREARLPQTAAALGCAMFWCGQIELARQLFALPKVNANFAEWLDLVLAGESGKAARKMQGMLEQALVINLPTRLLAAQTAVAARKDRLPYLKIAGVVSLGARQYNSSISNPPLLTRRIAAAGRLLRVMEESVPPQTLWVEHFGQDIGVDASYCYTLAMAFRGERLAVKDRVDAGKYLARLAATVFYPAGYVNFAREIFAAIGTEYDVATYAAVRTEIEAKATPLTDEMVSVPVWQKFLDRVGQIEGGTANKTAETGILHWVLVGDLDEINDQGAFAFKPCLKQADGKIVPCKSVRTSMLVSSEDTVFGMLPDVIGSARIRNVLESLAGFARLLYLEDKLEYNYWGEYRRYNLTNKGCEKVQPLNIVRRALRVERRLQSDGTMVLELPDLPKTNAPEDGLPESRFYWDSQLSQLTIISISRSIGRLAQLVAEFGNGNSITMPAGCFAAVDHQLRRHCGDVEVDDRLQDGVELPEIAAGGRLCVAIDFGGDTLEVAALVDAGGGAADGDGAAAASGGDSSEGAAFSSVEFVPGEGDGEVITVNAAQRPVRLRRDLAAESANLVRLRERLADFEKFRNEENRWTVIGIDQALEALHLLKQGEGEYRLVWKRGRRVNVVSASQCGAKLTSHLSAQDWFRVEGEFELDDGRVLTMMQMVAAVSASKGNFVQLSDGDYLRLTGSMQRQLAALAAAGRRKGDGLEIVKAAVPMLDGVFGEGEGSLALPEAMRATAEEIRDVFSRRPEPPSGLQAKLRSYQLSGYRWLSRLAGCGFGSCLADDMGLGKTLQIIALLLERSGDGPSLVIAPSSVCGNWRSEIKRFAPSLAPVMAHEGVEQVAQAGKGDVVIASYGYLLFHAGDFTGRDWNGIVLDEAQAIKNDATRRAKLVKDLRGRFRVAATGTPVENRLGELWSIFDFLNPGLLGPAASFISRLTIGGRASPELKRMVKPLILRRLKGDVLKDLPEKTEITIPVELGAVERAGYEGCRRHALSVLENGNAHTNRMAILAELTRLRRYCCHPSLVLPAEEIPSAKLEAVLGVMEDLIAGGHRALIFSQFTDYLAIVRRQVERRGWQYQYLDGGTPTLLRERAVKAFQGGEGEFFLISLKAGGTGLTLTAADYVLLLDPWWNPAVETQAADRAHRIGQTRNVTVYRFIAAKTVEERVIELHKEKLAIAADVLDGTASAALSPEQLMKLFN